MYTGALALPAYAVPCGFPLCIGLLFFLKVKGSNTVPHQGLSFMNSFSLTNSLQREQDCCSNGKSLLRNIKATLPLDSASLTSFARHRSGSPIILLDISPQAVVFTVDIERENKREKQREKKKGCPLNHHRPSPARGLTRSLNIRFLKRFLPIFLSGLSGFEEKEGAGKSGKYLFQYFSYPFGF